MNSAQCYVAAWWEAGWGRMDTCICMAESFPCSPDTVTTLLTGYTSMHSTKLKTTTTTTKKKTVPKFERNCRGPYLFWLAHNPVIIKCSFQDHHLEWSKEKKCAVIGHAEISPERHPSWSWKPGSEGHYHFRYWWNVHPQHSAEPRRCVSNFFS